MSVNTMIKHLARYIDVDICFYVDILYIYKTSNIHGYINEYVFYLSEILRRLQSGCPVLGVGSAENLQVIVQTPLHPFHFKVRFPLEYLMEELYPSGSRQLFRPYSPRVKKLSLEEQYDCIMNVGLS